METLDNVSYLRATEINAYLECPAKMMFQSIEKINAPNKIALAGGTAVHSALQVNYEQKIISREDLPAQDVADAFSDAYEKEIIYVDKADFDIEKPGSVKDSWLEVLKIYLKEVAPRIFPKKVEERVRFKLKGYQHGISCKLDIFDEYAVVVDHKTTSKPYKTTPENYKLQVGGAYALARKVISQTDSTQEAPKQSRIDYLVRRSPKNQVPHVRNIAVEIDTDYFLNVFEQVSNGVNSGIFPPNRQHLYCTKRFCKFWNNCELKFGGRVRE